MKMGVDDSFKSKFYNLQGVHLNERKKNFYKLLKSTSLDTPPEDIDIHPRNLQERIFFVDILIHFKKTKQLLEILTEGNDILVSRILKQPFFFKEAFKTMSEIDLVNTFLPSLSYSLRMRFLKKLSLSLPEERMDRIFDCVLERYGLFVASQFLFSCSNDKIIHFFQANELRLLPEQLKRIFQKDPYLIKVYFEEHKKMTGRDFDGIDFLKYVAWKNPQFYLQCGLNIKDIHIILGRCTTKKLIKTNKEQVVKEVQQYKNMLHHGSMVREIKEFDKICLGIFFPSDMKDLIVHRYRAPITKLVNSYPVKRRWDIISQTFTQVYQKDICNHLDLFDDNLASSFPTKIKHKWAEIKYHENENIAYLQSFDTKRAVTLLREKINLTSDISKRGKLLNQSIRCCIENKDYKTLEDVLKYICLRHRNDDQYVRSNMLSELSNDASGSLKEIHWKYITEMIDVQRVKNEYLSYDVISQYLIFVTKSKLPTHKAITQYINDVVKSERTTFRLIKNNNKNDNVHIESSIMKNILRIFEEITIDKKNHYAVILLSDVVNFNKTLEHNRSLQAYKVYIPENSVLIDVIKTAITKEESFECDDYTIIIELLNYNVLVPEQPLKIYEDAHLFSHIKKMGEDDTNGYLFCEKLPALLKKLERSDFENNLLNYLFSSLFLKHGIAWGGRSTTKYFLRNDPIVILHNFDKILQMDVKYNVLKYSTLKRYSHLNLDSQLTMYFLSQLDSNSGNQVSLVKALSQVMKVEDFVKLVEKYEPQSTKLDLNDEKQRKLFQFQCELSKTLKNVEQPLDVVPTIMKFCVGDYLQSALRSLYSVLYRIPERNTHSYINLLSEQAVSARKHALYFGFELLPIQKSMDLYTSIATKETNSSSKKYLITAVLQFFLKNPLEPVLDVVIININLIDKNDTELLTTLIDSVHRIPKKYKPLFIEKAWSFLVILKQSDVKVHSYQNILLEFIKEDLILNMSENFCKTVITNYFLSEDKSLMESGKALVNFVVRYLLSYTDEQHYAIVFNILSNYKKQYWNSDDNPKIEHMFSFFNSAYIRFPEMTKKSILLFKSLWEHVFTINDSFFEYVLLKLMELHKEYTHINIFSKEVDNFFKELIVSHGPYINNILYDAVNSFFMCVSGEKEFSIELFAYSLISRYSSGLNCYLACKIVKASSNKEMYLKIVNVLKRANGYVDEMFCNDLKASHNY